MNKYNIKVGDKVRVLVKEVANTNETVGAVLIVTSVFENNSPRSKVGFCTTASFYDDPIGVFDTEPVMFGALKMKKLKMGR